MRTSKALYLASAALAALLLAASPSAAQQSPAQRAVRANQLGGVVTSAHGPEAGVWVIAETTDLPTKFVKIVVTDEQGRYLMPDLPKAGYKVWVRGYGLVDSAKTTTGPGRRLDLKAALAPNAAAAAQYYPALYWFSMLKIPAASDFPGTGTAANGNGINPAIKTQAIWLDGIKTDGCVTCHQLGNKATRVLSPKLGHFDSSIDAWARRIQSGQASGNMINAVTRLGPNKSLGLLADWTDRIAQGELPRSQPSRPAGIERNVVLTIWDWSSAKSYLHDEVSTDRRDPTKNPNGLIYGSPELSTDFVPVLDPKRNKTSVLRIPVRDANTPTTHDDPEFAPSIYWGDEKVWDSQANVHNPMYDDKGRVWFTARIRAPENPAWCKAGSDHPSAKLFPLASANRQLVMYDPKVKKFTLIDTCFTTHHLQFDKNGVLWLSSGAGSSDVIGWFDVKKFDRTHDEKASQGWAPMVLDTNGNGRRDAYVEPNQPVDPAKDKRIRAGLYGVSPSPVDGTVWGSTLGFPGGIVHIIPGDNPPETTMAEFFEAPFANPKAPVHGFSPRGMDIDSQGVVWAPLASGHLASFDRRKCQGPMNGPQATGPHCPEGWTLYPFPGPQFETVSDNGSAKSSYYDWVDQHDTLGLGKDVPIATGNESDALLALKDGKWVVLRVPYPMGFFAKGLDGRIDDEKAGWKGRGLWSTFGNRTPQHIEGNEERPKVIHFQLRPDPLAG